MANPDYIPLRGPLPGTRKMGYPLPAATALPKPPKAPRPVPVEEPNGVLREASDQLRKNQMRVTTPRMEMVRALAAAPHPLSAEGLHEKVGKHCDLVTVYRSIAAFVQIGIARKLYSFDGTVLYLLATNEPEFVVLPKSGAAGARLAPDLARELEASIQKVTEHLKASGHQNVQPVVQFFTDKA